MKYYFTLLFFILEFIRTLNSGISGFFTYSNNYITYVNSPNLNYTLISSNYERGYRAASFAANYQNINHSFNIGILLTNKNNGVFSFKYYTLNQTSFTIMLNYYSSSNVTISIPECKQSGTLVPITLISTSLVCSNSIHNYNVTYSSNTQPITNSSFKSMFDYSSYTFTSILNIALSISIISSISIATSLLRVIDLDISVSVSLIEKMYAVFSNEVFTIGVCSSKCLQCDSSFNCITCQPGFTLLSNNCICNLKLIEYYSPTTLSYPLYANISPILYFCTNDLSSLTYDSCNTTLMSIFMPSIINFNFTSNSLTSSNYSIQLSSILFTNNFYISDSCYSNSYIYWTFSIATENQFSKYTQTNSTFPLTSLRNTFSFSLSNNILCQNYTYTGYNIDLSVCPVNANIVRNINQTNYIIQRYGYNLIYINAPDFGLTNYKITAPNFQIQDYFNSSSTNYLSFLVCKDIYCVNNISNNLFSSLDSLYVIISLTEPFFVFGGYKPDLVLTINNELRQSLVLSISNQNTYIFNIKINLNTTELSGVLNISNKLSYSTSFNNQNVIINNYANFTISINNTGSLIISSSFTNSVIFLWLLLMISIIVLSFIIGGISFICSKQRGMEKLMNEDNKNIHVTPERFKDLKLFELKDLKNTFV